MLEMCICKGNNKECTRCNGEGFTLKTKEEVEYEIEYSQRYIAYLQVCLEHKQAILPYEYQWEGELTEQELHDRIHRDIETYSLQIEANQEIIQTDLWESEIVNMYKYKEFDKSQLVCLKCKYIFNNEKCGNCSMGNFGMGECNFEGLTEEDNIWYNEEGYNYILNEN